MRHVLVVVLVASLSLVVARNATAQAPARPASGSGSGSGSAAAAPTPGAPTTAAEAKSRERIEMERFGPKFVRTLTNVEVELTITDQTGGEKPEKKTVSMIVSSGSWGKIRSSGSLQQAGVGVIGVELNVDARPFVSVDGPIQLELTLNYVPPGMALPGKDNATVKTGLNQSFTVVLQPGKPLIISRSADPVGDRKIIIEAKATVLK
jgi:hypothetical protein